MSKSVNSGNQLWFVGRYPRPGEEMLGRGEWGIQGLFTSEAAAIAACRDEFYFVGPVLVNHIYPDKVQDWPGQYFPKLEPKKRR